MRIRILLVTPHPPLLRPVNTKEHVQTYYYLKQL